MPLRSLLYTTQPTWLFWTTFPLFGMTPPWQFLHSQGQMKQFFLCLWRTTPRTLLSLSMEVKGTPLLQLSKNFHSCIFRRNSSLTVERKLFSENQADDMTPRLPDYGLKPKYGKSSFLFTVVFHIYIFVGSSIGIILILPYVFYAVKHRKLKTLVSAMTMYRASTGEAAPIPNLTAPLTAIDIPTHPASKLVCHDPWVSFLMATITVIGVILYFYKSCKHLTLVRGYKFASLCHIYIIVGNATRYVPVKIGQHVGSPYLFKYTDVIPRERLSFKNR